MQFAAGDCRYWSVPDGLEAVMDILNDNELILNGTLHFLLRILVAYLKNFPKYNTL